MRYMITCIRLGCPYMLFAQTSLAMAVVGRGYPKSELLELHPQRITGFRPRSCSDWMESLKLLEGWEERIWMPNGVVIVRM